MCIRQVLTIATLVAAIGGLIVPAFAEGQNGAERAPDNRMNMGMGGAGGGMMHHGMMRDGMMSGGCGGMMQSMKGGDGRPNRQWLSHPPGNANPG